MFGLFKKSTIEKSPIDWAVVAGRVAGLLAHLMSTDPSALVNPYARIVLHKKGDVSFSDDKRDPRYLLGWGDISYAFIRENKSALQVWVDDLNRSLGSPAFQLIATESFAKKITLILMNNEKR